MTEENKKWITSDNRITFVNSWYKSKRGNIFIVNRLLEDGGLEVTSHTTGNNVIVPPEQVKYIKLCDDPETPCGAMLLNEHKSNIITTNPNKYINLYEKYPHVILGSIRKVPNKGKPLKTTKRKGPRPTAYIVKCKIKCQENGCDNEREIKIQDAFQVKYCESCRDKRKKNKKKKAINDKQGAI